MWSCVRHPRVRGRVSVAHSVDRVEFGSGQQPIGLPLDSGVDETERWTGRATDLELVMTTCLDGTSKFPRSLILETSFPVLGTCDFWPSAMRAQRDVLRAPTLPCHKRGVPSPTEPHPSSTKILVQSLRRCGGTDRPPTPSQHFCSTSFCIVLRHQIPITGVSQYHTNWE